MELAKYLRTKAQFRWLLSYDNNPMLTESPWLYANARMTPRSEDRETLGVQCWTLTKRLVTTRYTASGKNGKRTADELLITTLPSSTVPIDHQLRELPHPEADAEVELVADTKAAHAAELSDGALGHGHVAEA